MIAFLVTFLAVGIGVFSVSSPVIFGGWLDAVLDAARSLGARPGHVHFQIDPAFMLVPAGYAYSEI